MSQQFFRFRNNSAYNPQFTYAIRIHSRSENVDEVCSECQSIRKYPSGAFDVSVEEGNQYPDLLQCGAFPFLIVSKAVIQDWEAAGVTSFHTYPVGIAEVYVEELVGIAPPDYFRIEVDGRCKIDIEASGLHVIEQCPKCHRVVTEPMVPTSFQMVAGSWDGSPIFRDADLYRMINFCTEQIFELARKHKRTNFRFEPMNKPFDSFSEGINYLEE